MTVIHQPKDHKFVALAEDHSQMGEIEYTVHRDGDLYATHTWTEPPYRGRGVATAMLDAMAAMAEERGVKIVPVCPFVREAFRSHPEQYRKVMRSEAAV